MNRAEALDKVKVITTSDRNKTHGDPLAQFKTAQALKDILDLPSLTHLNPVEVESLQTICTKLSRIVHGRPNTAEIHKWEDHWLDIMGYASICVESHNENHPTEAEPVDDIRAIAERFAFRG